MKTAKETMTLTAPDKTKLIKIHGLVLQKLQSGWTQGAFIRDKQGRDISDDEHGGTLPWADLEDATFVGASSTGARWPTLYRKDQPGWIPKKWASQHS